MGLPKRICSQTIQLKENDMKNKHPLENDTGLWYYVTDTLGAFLVACVAFGVLAVVGVVIAPMMP